MIPILTGFVLDFIFGDPNFCLHPIRLMGKLIAFLENAIRKVLKSDVGELWGGIILVAAVCGISFFSAYFLLKAAYGLNTYFGFVLESVLCWLFIAAKSLKAESMKVFYALKNNGLKSAREAVSMIVGRDTERLDEEGVIKAAVETVAENTSDGVIAPLFFMLLGGAPLGCLYKAINTMDSMVGYKNKKYMYFGRAAARLDDIANFIPSRISAVLMIASAFILRLDYKNAIKIFRRDRLRHKSPNSAQTEAVCAGALDIQLAGDAWYFGELHKKDFIGDPLRKIVPEDIITANRLMYMTSVLAVVLGLVIRGGF